MGIVSIPSIQLQVDFIKRKIITDIAMQGKDSDEKFFVETYEMSYTEDSYSWKIYQENGTNMVRLLG